MTLEEIVEQLELLDDELVICAKQPWQAKAEALLVNLDKQYRIPKETLEEGYAYFLEVATAKEVLEVLGQKNVSFQQKIDCILYYAENDAYPEWVYQ